MSNSREESPDWLRAFEAPSRDVVTLSSGSDSSPENSPSRSALTPQEGLDKYQENNSVLIDSGEDSPTIKSKKPKTAKTETCQVVAEDTLEAQEEGPDEQDREDKPAGPSVSQRLPLVFPDKVHHSKALVECDGDSIDLSGDMGAVGRIIISNGHAGNNELLLDLKGTVYKTTIVPSRTFCIVNVGQSEAKIEAIMNDFVQLEPQSNVFEAETMIEGTLNGFSFDSEEEADKVPKPSSVSDQKDENVDQANKKGSGKVKKLPGAVHKKGKTAERQPKKAVRKHPVLKRTKKSKK
ncbi:uncharacterized protein [Typha latifolia]|uniref:uncharacterized protein isoform X2 n=1 Tax=Typha latifolia TaxID=4733 RepID=UPI003C30D122